MVNFNKIIFAFVIFFLAFGVKSYSEIVNKVKVEGNERISLETILIFGDITIGKDYKSPDINMLIKKLYETTFFSNISVELQDGQLSIIVEENPIIMSVVFKGEKAEKYKEVIREVINLREKTSFRSNYINTDINIIKEFYRSLGFYFVDITAEVEKLDKNRVNLVYSIDKGEKAKIAKIYFLGDKKIREKKLRDIITSEEATFWKFISRNVYLNKSRIELDERLLKNYYKNKGYYEIEVTSSNVEYAEGKGFILTFSIDAGKRYKFKKIFLNVAETLDKSAFMSLEKEFNKIVGDYYSQRKLSSILEKIDRLSERKELQFINHKIVETLDDDSVEVKIDIFEGEKFIIERINIVGNSVTNDSVIRGEMIVDEGDPYSVLLVNKSINRLKGRGIFGKIEHKVIEGSTPDLKVLEINIEERATGEIMAGAGVGTDGTSFMAAVSENNWLGKGIQLQSAINITEAKIAGNISVNNPNYNFSGNSVYTSFEASATDRSASSGYESSRTGLALGTQFEQYENIFLAPSISASYEDIEVQSDASDQIKKMDGTFSNLDFSYAIVLDKRNQIFQPTSGYRTKFQQSFPIIMDSSSIMNGFDVSTYRAFSDDLIGSVKFLVRTIHGLDDDDVRLTNRLYLPARRLRGFQTRRVGPKDGEDWVGGNYTTALNFEAQLPNLLPESYRTDFSMFLDAGNVWGVDYSDTLDETNNIRSSVGMSANVWTTVGPLSFTIAQHLSKSTNDETESFNFRIGTSF